MSINAALPKIEVSFTSNKKSFTSIEARRIQIFTWIYYDSTEVYNGPSEVWVDEAYRTITLEQPATGDLLTWLQRNAVKQ